MHGKRRERRKLKLISRKEAELKGLWRLEENQRRLDYWVHTGCWNAINSSL